VHLQTSDNTISLSAPNHNIPYKINTSGIHRPLGNKTMAARAVHYEDIMEYTAHNISAIRGYHDKHNIELKEGHLLTHSTFLGSGAHAAHGTPCVHH
jgi:alpha-glucosidase